jgi:hypothetical protein
MGFSESVAVPYQLLTHTPSSRTSSSSSNLTHCGQGGQALVFQHVDGHLSEPLEIPLLIGDFESWGVRTNP